MLTALVEKLVCPTCLTKEQGLQAHVFTPGADGHIRNGVLTCPACKAFYPIEDDLLELVVAALWDTQDRAQFCARFRNELNGLGLLGKEESNAKTEDLSAQLKQREHFDWYAENTDQDYTQYQNSPFWRAADEVAFTRWKKQIQPGAWLLDVGCANGRSAFPFLDGSTTVIGFDISKKLVRQGTERARTEGFMSTSSFFVADGSRLPFRDQTFDNVVIYGVLHHLPSPGNICRDVPRILKPDGIYFGSENNQSMFRGLFDMMMKLSPLWTEEAGEQPLISRGNLAKWVDGLPVKLNYSTSVFLPPHMFNLMGNKAARSLLPLTDRLFSWAPGIRNQGGLLVFEIQKSAA